MRRPRWIVASLLSGSLAAGLMGCGGKSKNDDYEPPPAVVANTQAPPVTPPKTEPPKDPDPSPPMPMIPVPKDPVGTLPQVPPPELPKPKDPPKDPPPFVPPPPPPMPEAKKEPDKPDPKEPFKWPLSMYGRSMGDFIKDINNSDPAIREAGLRTLPFFGPNAREPGTKVVLWHMQVANEKDPGVRAAAFEAVGAFVQLGKEPGLEKDADTLEAVRILCLAADEGRATRLHAINTLASFGNKAETAIPYLIGQNMTVLEPAYETRRAVATTLGAIAYNKDNGPNHKALHCLTDVLIKDRSAAVRLAAYQSIVQLGPPQMPAPSGGPVGAPKLVIDPKAAAVCTQSIKTRLLPYKPEVGNKDPEPLTGLMERDRQVEIFARLCLMRFDPKEMNDENFKGIAKYVTEGRDSGPKLQALFALGLMREGAARKIDDVIRGLEDDDPNVATAAVTTLVMMGREAKPAIEFLQKMKKRGSPEGEKDAKDYTNKYYVDLATRAIDAIEKAPKPKP